MNADGPAKDSVAIEARSTEELISRLSSRNDYWYNLAQTFPRLHREGVDAVTLEQMIDLSPARQNLWVVASSVFASLKQSGQLSAEQLKYFNNEHLGPDCLMELRFLDIGRRVNGAAYIADRGLGHSDAVLLARAIKEHERRPDSNEGFTDAAGDCLAFKYYRDALESRNDADVQRLIKNGLQVVETDSARAKLDALYKSTQEVEVVPTAELLMVRLSKDDVGSRVLAVAGNLDDATAQDVRSAPRVESEGVFGIFQTPDSSARCVLLPRYNFLAVAEDPVALFIPDASQVPEVIQATGIKNSKDAAKLNCAAILVADRKVGAIKKTSFYLVEKDGKLALVSGAAATNPVAYVVFVSMPSRRDSTSSQSFEF